MGIDVDSRRQQREVTQASSAPLLSLGLKGDSGAMADLVAQLPHVFDSAMQTRQTSAFIAGNCVDYFLAVIMRCLLLSCYWVSTFVLLLVVHDPLIDRL